MSLPLARISPDLRATYERSGLSDIDYARPRTTALAADTRAALAAVKGISKATFARLDKRLSSKKGMVESHLNNLAAVLAASPTNQSLSAKSLSASHKLYKAEEAKIWIVEWTASVIVSYKDPNTRETKTKTDHVSSQQFERFLVGYEADTGMTTLIAEIRHEGAQTRRQIDFDLRSVRPVPLNIFDAVFSVFVGASAIWWAFSVSNSLKKLNIRGL
jgi:hypothetical protein